MPIEILKLLIIMVFIIFLLKKKVDLGFNLLLNSFLLGLFFQIKIGEILIIWKNVSLKPTTLSLLGIIYLVYLLSIILEKLKKFERMSYSLQKLIQDYRFVMMLISAFVALLPIQGGAIFSAPMVKSMGENNQIKPEKNMFINYWFRHIWLFIWPLYPEVILYASLIDVPLKNLIFLFSPLALAAFVSGAIWVFKNLDKNFISFSAEKNNKKAALKEFLNSSWPVLAVILLVLFFDINLLVSLFLVIAILLIINIELNSQIIKLLKESGKTSHKTLLIIFGVFIFQGMLEHTGVVDILPGYFLSIGVPLVGILVLVPFLVSFFTGSATASVGICVPVFIAFLIGANGIIASRVILFYISSYIGLMATPIHLCMAITKDYFNIKMGDFYAILIKQLAILAVTSIIYYILLMNIFN